MLKIFRRKRRGGAALPEDARGVNTSEFYLVLVVVAAAAVHEFIGASEDPRMAMVAGACAFAYTAGRIWLKISRSRALPEADEAANEMRAVIDDLKQLRRDVKPGPQD